MKRLKLSQIIILIFILPLSVFGQWFNLPPIETFISDTLYIQVTQDSTLDVSASTIAVIDSRSVEGSILGIRQTKKFKAGRLGEIKIHKNEVLLGDPLIFNKKNIDKYDF